MIWNIRPSSYRTSARSPCHFGCGETLLHRRNCWICPTNRALLLSWRFLYSHKGALQRVIHEEPLRHDVFCTSYHFDSFQGLKNSNETWNWTKDTVIRATFGTLLHVWCWIHATITWPSFVVVNCELTFCAHGATRDQRHSTQNTCIIDNIACLWIIRCVHYTVTGGDQLERVLSCQRLIDDSKGNRWVQAINSATRRFCLIQPNIICLMNNLSMKIR
mmetsp:Transcript_33566/g.79151  ORF Transcript_33566/g.79151 Transcript_33566/m.79151 type:complete len:218 (-) Transcript_33566:505-1158(-)